MLHFMCLNIIMHLLCGSSHDNLIDSYQKKKGKIKNEKEKIKTDSTCSIYLVNPPNKNISKDDDPDQRHHKHLIRKGGCDSDQN